MKINKKLLHENRYGDILLFVAAKHGSEQQKLFWKSY
jgi:hypothetical protein